MWQWKYKGEVHMSIDEDFSEIASYTHMWNWLPEWDIVEKNL